MPIKETKTAGPMPEKIESLPKSKINKLIPLIVLLLAVAAAGGGAAYYYYSQLNDLKSNPQRVAEEENKTLIDRVSALIVLPSDEQPTIATVADPERLKEQAFFAKAKIGDKVLIYTNARKAILYDPVGNKIVEVAPLTIGTTAGATTGEDSETQTADE